MSSLTRIAASSHATLSLVVPNNELDHGHLPARRPALVWRFFLQCACGLQHMHSRQILHRDVKTPNVFLDERCNVKLGDLGVAKVLSSQTHFAVTLVGTPYYLSPELCSNKQYNAKSDVWALGCVLYECCTQVRLMTRCIVRNANKHSVKEARASAMKAEASRI